MNSKERAFDDILRQSLESIGPKLEPGHWELFEQAMKNPNAPNAFDAAIATSLQNGSEAPFHETQWERMAQELELDELVHGTASRTPDEEIAWKLDNLQARFNAKHWQNMSHLLDVAFILNPKILRLKLFEVASMLLLLLIALQLPMPGTQQAKLNPIAASEAAAPILSEVQTESATTLPIVENTQKSAAAIVQTGSDLSVHSAPSKSPPLPPAEPLELADLQLAKAATPPPLLPNAENQQEVVFHKEVGAYSEPELQQEPEEFERNLVNSLLPITTLNAELLQTDQKSFEKLPVHTKPGRGYWRVSMGASLDQNIVQTQNTSNLRPEATSYYLASNGFSSGINLSYRSQRVEFGIGAWHSTKRYQPQVPVQQFGTFDFLVIETFEGIQLDLLEIPVQVNYYLPKEPRRWNVYLSAGLQGSFILHPVYDIHRTVMQAQGKPPEDLNPDYEGLKSQLDRNGFPEGLMSGGAIGENASLRVSAGIGIERILSDRWALFAQPVYTHQILSSGIGPNNDRIHNVSLQFGTRVILR